MVGGDLGGGGEVISKGLMGRMGNEKKQKGVGECKYFAQ